VTCREVVELMTDYLDGALSATDRAKFDQHMQGCEAVAPISRSSALHEG